jgi:glycosyltransferase involved in cell wall biosynthesis
MAQIVLADDGIEFDGDTPRNGPLGGVESSIVNLVEELAKRGHTVSVRNMCRESRIIAGVDWAPLFLNDKYNIPRTADLYIANRGDKLIGLMPEARRTVFWIHNPAQYLLKWRYLSKLWRFKPAIIFIGNYHATTYPSWAPGGDRIVIPYGISKEFCKYAPREDLPPRRAIFTSNPLRSLDWLLKIWVDSIHPHATDAELHLFSGSATYGKAGAEKNLKMEEVLDRARAYKDQGVVLRGPVSKPKLLEEFREARVMLYRGDLNETFCLAVGEAQAAGVPAVVQNLGSVVERVIDRETGAIVTTNSDFVTSAIELLNDDIVWRRQHNTALAKQGLWSWKKAAKAFEELMII